MTRSHVFYVITITAIILLVGCKDNGPGPEPPPPQAETVQKTIDTEDSVTEEVVAPFTITSDGTTLAEDVSEYETGEIEKGTKKSFTITADGYQPKTRSITFNDGAPVTFQLSKKETEPETAKISASLLLDGDPYADATVYDDDSGNELASGEQFSLTREKGTELTVRIEGPDIETQTKTLVFDETKTIEISLSAAQATSVQLTITPEIAAFTARGRQPGDDFTSYEVTVDGQTYTNEGPDGSRFAEGQPFAVAVAAGRDITVSGRFIYEQERRSQEFGRHRSLATGETTVSLTEDDELTLELTHQPACSDNINNDDSDDVIDAQDNGCVKGFASRDPSSPEFEYEPEDDNEILTVITISSSSGKADERISGSKNERIQGLFSNTYSKTIQYAVGDINLSFENKIENDQDGEEFAIWVLCDDENTDPRNNPNTRTTDIVLDDQSVDGFRQSSVNGMTRDWVSDGLTCNFTAVHATKVRGEQPTDGADDIFFGTEDKSAGRTVQYFYESEKVK